MWGKGGNKMAPQAKALATKPDCGGSCDLAEKQTAGSKKKTGSSWLS